MLQIRYKLVSTQSWNQTDFFHPILSGPVGQESDQTISHVKLVKIRQNYKIILCHVDYDNNEKRFSKEHINLVTIQKYNIRKIFFPTSKMHFKPLLLAISGVSNKNSLFLLEKTLKISLIFKYCWLVKIQFCRNWFDFSSGLV